MQQLWKFFFKFKKDPELASLMRRCMRKNNNLLFQGFMNTDRVSCDFLFARVKEIVPGSGEKLGEVASEPLLNGKKKRKMPHITKPQDESPDNRILRLSECTGKIVTGVDTGRNSLITAAWRSEEDGLIHKFEYKPSRRSLDCRHEFFATKRTKWSMDAQQNVNNSRISETSSRSLQLEKFLDYASLKLKLH